MTPAETALYERIKGALIGCALGDAMGMPTEMWTRAKIKKQFPDGITTFLPAQSDDILGRALCAGSITDDTINTVMILEMIASQSGALDVKKYIDQLMLWYKSDQISAAVTGPSTKRALELIEKGISFEETGKMGTTNGAAMKISPVGFVSDYRDLSVLVRNVAQICIPTHNTNIAISGASIIAACVSYGISGGSSVDYLWDLANDVIEAAQNVGTPFPAPSLAYRLSHAQKIVSEHLSGKFDEETALDRIYDEIGATFETVDTVPAALAIVQLANGNPMVASRLCATLGGDTDTLGAISGAICGAMNPFFDPEVIMTLESVNYLDFHSLARQIAPYSPFFNKLYD